jgi:uncharacterized short protein YbdD (DUF466 family)
MSTRARSHAHTRWQQVRYWIREFFGENDYARYVADWNARHPEGGAAAAHGGGHRLLTEREFFDERLRIKYGGGVQRCC